MIVKDQSIWNRTAGQARRIDVPGLRGPRRGRRTSTLITAAAILAVFLLAVRPIATGSAHPVGDGGAFFCSVQILVADFARAGKLVLWNPWSNAGVPDCSEPQCGAFSPLLVFFSYAFGGTDQTFNWYWLASWFGGGLGMILLARHLGAPAWGAFLVGSGFLASGFFTGNSQHTSMVHAYAFLPWIVWRWDVALRRRRVWPAIEAGALWGLSALAGYPSIVIMTGGITAAWVLGRLLFAEADEPTDLEPGGSDAEAPARPWLVYGTAALLSLVVGVVVLNPTYLTFLIDGKGYSDRSGPLPREVAITSNAMHPTALMTLMSPDLAAMTLHNPALDIFPGNDVTSVSIYTGCVVLWLALSALLLRPGSGWRWWLAAMAALGLAIAVGGALPLRGWLYDLLPPMRYARHSSLFRGQAIFLISVLAALACRDLDGASRRRASPGPGPGRAEGRARLAVAGAGLAVAGMAILIHFQVMIRWPDLNIGPDRELIELRAYGCWSAVALMAVLAGLWPRRVRRAALPIALVALAAVDALLTVHLNRGTIWNNAHHDLHREVAAAHERKLELTGRGWRRNVVGSPRWGTIHNRNLVTKTPVLENYSAFVNNFHLSWARDPVLVGFATGPERIWFAPTADAAEAHLTDATFEAFRSRAHALGAPPMVVHPRKAMLHPRPTEPPGPHEQGEAARIAQLPAARRIAAPLHRYEPDKLTFRVEAPQAGYLLITDRWARGWEATVNGRPAVVLGGTFIFRVLAVERGVNRITLRYRPFGHPYLLLASWGLLACVGGGSIWTALARRRRPGPSRIRLPLQGRLGVALDLPHRLRGPVRPDHAHEPARAETNDAAGADDGASTRRS